MNEVKLLDSKSVDKIDSNDVEVYQLKHLISSKDSQIKYLLNENDELKDEITKFSGIQRKQLQSLEKESENLTKIQEKTQANTLLRCEYNTYKKSAEENLKQSQLKVKTQENEI